MQRLMDLARPGVAVLAVAVWLVASVLLFRVSPYMALGEAAGGPLLEERAGYSHSQAQELLELLGSEGRADYRQFQTMDSMNALLMMVALTLVMAFVVRRLFHATSPLRWLMALPIIAGLTEWIENSLLFAQSWNFPSSSSSLGNLPGLITTIKLVIASAALLAVALGLIAAAIKKALEHKRPSVQ